MLKLIAHSVYGYCLAVKKIFTEKPTCCSEACLELSHCALVPTVIRCHGCIRISNACYEVAILHANSFNIL